MHELGITQSIVEIVAEHAGSAKVNRVTLEIGRLSAVLPDAIRFCFDMCTQGTSWMGRNSRSSRSSDGDAAGSADRNWK